MIWNEVIKTYPYQWVLIEAIKARTESEKRLVEHMDIIGNFNEDGEGAFQKYIEMHKLHKDREYYIYHTSHDNLEISIKRWMGVRL